ncbi:hypothetical protein MtrunA17_Chr4g0000591 [Medicago truncatula]|uniref:Uncharacterized protein n=1 Tax=Medicago truncatula TaxID=3880 RepID=G7JVL3_MEDTR|nr:uncharacterized protein LOC11423726 [Medicago truncatula]AES86350.1 hypothetical protein MTR_4g006030 [Medicago truncatula]RHN58274.1 hypothetical protein MtrunA17_Chr4g0000591 [Medicago truncatula]
MNTATVSTPSWWCCIQTHHQHHSPPHFFPRPIHPQFKGLRLLYRKRVVESRWENGAVSGSNEVNVSPWDDKPFEILPNGKRSYLDEQDVVAFLDPPNTLIPLDPTSYNPAAYLWKKIEDIPEERRHRLLLLINPRLISMAWQIAGTRYEDPKLVKKSESTLLISSNKDDVMLEYYNCRTSGGPMPISWINSFRKAIFSGKDGKTYGRLIGGSALASFANSFAPLYFTMTQVKEVLSTEQPCDLAYEFGDGLYDIKELPLGFPRPVKHPYPFNDQIVIYVRYLGPGVSVGQAWQEGNKLEQIPQKLCGGILMVKDYTSLQEPQ